VARYSSSAESLPNTVLRTKKGDTLLYAQSSSSDTRPVDFRQVIWFLGGASGPPKGQKSTLRLQLVSRTNFVPINADLGIRKEVRHASKTPTRPRLISTI
jgi:hypothetical protein